MKVHRPGWRGALVSAGVVAVVAGVTFGALTLAGVTFQGEGEAQERLGAQRVGGPLLTANRDRLAICVETVGVNAAIAVSAKVEVEAALDEAARNPIWEKAGLSKAAPTVDVGCPAPPAVFDADAEVTTSGTGLIVNTPPVKEASYYRTFLFIVPPETLASTFAGEYPLATQEWLKISLDNMIPVTLGLYVSPDQLSDRVGLAGWLLVAAGVIGSPPVDALPLPSQQ